MPLTPDQIVEETRQWPPDVRAELVEHILLSAPGGIPTPRDDAGQQETRRRAADNFRMRQQLNRQNRGRAMNWERFSALLQPQLLSARIFLSFL